MSKWSGDASPLLMRHERLIADLTIAELSTVSGLSPTTICNVENGKHKPVAKTLTKWAKGCQCDVSQFFEFDIATVKALSDKRLLLTISTIPKRT